MKLSKIKGDRVFDVIADIIGPITEIAADENASKLFMREKCPEDMTPYQVFLQRMKACMPPLVRDHKEAFETILASIEGVSVDEYVKSLTLGKLLADVIDLVSDEDFVAFFV